MIAIVQLRKAKPYLFLWAEDEIIGGFTDCLIANGPCTM